MIWYGIGDVAGFAVHAVRRVQADAFAVRLRRVVHHLVDVRRTEILARAAEFFHAARVADVGVVNDQVRGLVFFVLRAGVVEVGELVEGQLAVALRRADADAASSPPSAGSSASFFRCW